MATTAHYELPPLPTVPPPPAASPAAQLVDVKLFDTVDGGEIEILSGIVTLTDGLDTAAYLSLFGGNEDDDATAATESKQWWGNLGETDATKTYRSRFQAALKALTSIPANLRKLEDAANADLAWFVSDSIASSVSAVATMPARNRVNVVVKLVIDNVEYKLDFATQWGTR